VIKFPRTYILFIRSSYAVCTAAQIRYRYIRSHSQIWLLLLLLETVTHHLWLRVYVAQIHMDLSSDFWRNRTDDLEIKSSSLWPTYLDYSPLGVKSHRHTHWYTSNRSSRCVETFLMWLVGTLCVHILFTTSHNYAYIRTSSMRMPVQILLFFFLYFPPFWCHLFGSFLGETRLETKIDHFALKARLH